ncbi:MAG: hypothetical protein EOP45_22090, partial [Sphingobacteriaceae bacterium]
MEILEMLAMSGADLNAKNKNDDIAGIGQTKAALSLCTN